MNVDELDYEQTVNRFYESVYRFALSLTHREDRAGDLTQETFFRLLEKGKDIQDPSKVKSWLFTTAYRIFLGTKRQEARWPEYEISSVDHELPSIANRGPDEVDAALVLECVFSIEERYRSPLILYYLDEHSYCEIAEILDIPAGTVMSRLSRGKDLVRKLLNYGEMDVDRKLVPGPGQHSKSEREPRMDANKRE